MTISYKKETPLEKHLHEFRDYDFKIQVERLNTNNARIYFVDKDKKKIHIPKNVTCYNLTSNIQENFYNINGTECFLNRKTKEEKKPTLWKDSDNVEFKDQ
ncbi:5777_t:CDS:2, partial [Scutellospora calospora]